MKVIATSAMSSLPPPSSVHMWHISFINFDVFAYECSIPLSDNVNSSNGSLYYVSATISNAKKINEESTLFHVKANDSISVRQPTAEPPPSILVCFIMFINPQKHYVSTFEQLNLLSWILSLFIVSYSSIYGRMFIIIVCENI